MKYKPFYRRNLPHLQPKGNTFFVTFRLYNSIPVEIVEELSLERKILEEHFRQNNLLKGQLSETINRIFFQKYEAYLDHSSDGPLWLKEEAVAKTTQSALHFWDQKRINLIAYCIMPNHVHAVFQIYKKYEDEFYLMKCMKSIKNYSAKQANLFLGRTGNPFWQAETYDRMIRDQEELIRLINYIQKNPFKAVLVTSKDTWPWTYIHPSFLTLIDMDTQLSPF